MANKTLYIIDGHAQIYRAYYAPFGALSSPKGEPTRAVHVFTQMVLNLLRDKRPRLANTANNTGRGAIFDQGPSQPLAAFQGSSDVALRDGVSEPGTLGNWSERRDLNSRPLRPQRGRLGEAPPSSG